MGSRPRHVLGIGVGFCSVFAVKKGLVLDGDFLWLGVNWFNAVNDCEGHAAKGEGEKITKTELLSRIFPRQAECTVNYYGSSGKNHHNFICVLPSNSVSQYVFLILWVWYVALLIISGLNLVYTILMVLRISGLRKAYLLKVLGSSKVKKHVMITNINHNFLNNLFYCMIA